MTEWQNHSAQEYVGLEKLKSIFGKHNLTCSKAWVNLKNMYCKRKLSTNTLKYIFDRLEMGIRIFLVMTGIYCIMIRVLITCDLCICQNLSVAFAP